MPKLLKNLNIAIDLEAIVNKSITRDTPDLLHHNSYKGSLGIITLLSEVFDLYLLVPESKIKQEEILRWLKAGDINTSFRKFFTIDEKIRDIILTSSINVTITSRKELAESLKDTTKVFYIKKKNNDSIQDGIYPIDHWKDIIKHLSFFSNT